MSPRKALYVDSCPSPVTSTLTSIALRCWWPCHLLPLQVLRRLHRRGPPQGRGLVHTPANLLCPLQGPLGSLPVPEQHLHAAQGGPGQVHRRLIDAAMEAELPTPSPRTSTSGLCEHRWVWHCRSLHAPLQLQGLGCAYHKGKLQDVKLSTNSSKMQCEWLGERVAAPNLKTVTKNVILNKTAGNWGPNATFRFPARDGTGGIWIAVANTLPKEKKRFGKKGDCQEGQRGRQAGHLGRWHHMIQLQRTRHPPWPSTTWLKPWTTRSSSAEQGALLLQHPRHRCRHPWRAPSPTMLGSHRRQVLALLPRGQLPLLPCHHLLQLLSLQPAPEDNVKLPTIQLANGSKTNHASPRRPILVHHVGGLRVSDEARRPGNILKDCIQGLINTEMLKPEDEIVSTYHRRFDHGYPHPLSSVRVSSSSSSPRCRTRASTPVADSAVGGTRSATRTTRFMLGVEAVDNIVNGAVELTLNYPDFVNGRQNTERRLGRRCPGFRQEAVDNSPLVRHMFM